MFFASSHILILVSHSFSLPCPNHESCLIIIIILFLWVNPNYIVF